MSVATSVLHEGPGARQTAAQRRSLPDFRDIAQNLAEQEHICIRPLPMRAIDPTTGTASYLGAPCKSTVASVCPACADKARFLRITQCREGWHLDHEPENEKTEPTEHQTALLAARSDLFETYQQAKADGDEEMMSGVREIVADLDEEMKASGFRGRLPALDKDKKPRRARSTRRRQDAPNLPRLKVAKTTVGRTYTGGHQPSMFITLTMPSYGAINRDGATNNKGEVVGDGSPRDPDSYDYERAARDVVHFSALFDRWIQNLRRAVGWNIQYFATVEPQKRGAPHLHILIRGTVSRDLIRQVTAATYHQVWWPSHDRDSEVFPGDIVPVWDPAKMTFTDPGTGSALLGFDDVQDLLDDVEDLEPAHVVRFGDQMDRADIRGFVPGEKANRAVGYVTKYLTKSISDILDTDSDRTRRHYERLHAELQHTPCSPRCPVWLRYGIVPRGATEKTVSGRCKGKAHRRDTLGLPGRRVLVSRQWSNKTLPDHKADRAEFVRQLLASVGIVKPDTSHLQLSVVKPGDRSAPPRDHLIMAAIAQRKTWRAEYTRALLAAGPPALQDTSAIPVAA
ncbi:replication initiator [Nocardia flavorosea]|uniref:replication initiator n=1 Tax=Nocardia flavorosea TaxID=53429 RepID=UPI0007A4E14A|nr:replication initiator [Nocardia flavorosea]